MAQRFLERLPKVRKADLPKGAECMICKEEYGTVASDNGTVEHAVLLPCLHHVGSECISIWLSPGDGLGNSCPLCRTVFFPTYLRDYDDDEDEDEDEDSEDENNDEEDEGGSNEEDEEGSDEGSDGEDKEDEEDGDEPEEPREQILMNIVAAFHSLASRSISTHPLEEAERKERQEWFQRWPSPTHQQIKNGEKRARRELLRPSSPSGVLQRTPSQSSPPPEDLELLVAQLASAYCTITFRETLLYMKLTEAGAQKTPLASPHSVLTAHQEEMLTWELSQRGALSDARVRSRYMGMTNRQCLHAHRAKGEVYTYDTSAASGRGYWDAGLGFGLRE